MSGCPMWDELHKCCMWDRMEKIFRYPWEEKETDPVIEECLEEMP